MDAPSPRSALAALSKRATMPLMRSKREPPQTATAQQPVKPRVQRRGSVIEKKLKHRTRVVRELVESEQTFIDTLAATERDYMRPLKMEGILDEQQIATIFSQIPVLRGLSSRFLDELRQRVRQWSSLSTKIGDILDSFIPFFKMYCSYAQNHAGATKMLRELYENNDSFAAFMDERHATGRGGLDALLAQLITPIQHVPRYRLLLQDIVKHTLPNHPDFERLNLCLAKVKEVCTFINESVRAAEERQKLLELQSRFAGDVELVAPSRALVQEGELVKENRRGSLSRYVFVLMTDLLAYASEALIGTQLVLHRRLPVDAHFAVRDLPPQEDRQYRFEIQNSVKTFSVCADTREIKDQWLKALRQVIAAFEETRKTRTQQKQKAQMDRNISEFFRTLDERASPVPPRHADVRAEGQQDVRAEGHRPTGLSIQVDDDFSWLQDLHPLMSPGVKPQSVSPTLAPETGNAGEDIFADFDFALPKASRAATPDTSRNRGRSAAPLASSHSMLGVSLGAFASSASTTLLEEADRHEEDDEKTDAYGLPKRATSLESKKELSHSASQPTNLTLRTIEDPFGFLDTVVDLKRKPSSQRHRSRRKSEFQMSPRLTHKSPTLRRQVAPPSLPPLQHLSPPMRRTRPSDMPMRAPTTEPRGRSSSDAAMQRAHTLRLGRSGQLVDPFAELTLDSPDSQQRRRQPRPR